MKSAFAVPVGSRGDSQAIVAQLHMIVSRIMGSNGRDSTSRIAAGTMRWDRGAIRWGWAFQLNVSGSEVAQWDCGRPAPCPSPDPVWIRGCALCNHYQQETTDWLAPVYWRSRTCLPWLIKDVKPTQRGADVGSPTPPNHLLVRPPNVAQAVNADRLDLLLALPRSVGHRRGPKVFFGGPRRARNSDDEFGLPV